MSTDKTKKTIQTYDDRMSQSKDKQSQMKKDKVPTEACSFHLPKDLFDRARDWAAYNGMSFTRYVTELLMKDLKTKDVPPRRKKAIAQVDLKFLANDKPATRE